MHYYIKRETHKNFRQESDRLKFVKAYLNHTHMHLTGGDLKSGQHFKFVFLLYYGIQEDGFHIISNLVQYAIDGQNITKITKNE